MAIVPTRVHAPGIFAAVGPILAHMQVPLRGYQRWRKLKTCKVQRACPVKMAQVHAQQWYMVCMMHMACRLRTWRWAVAAVM